MNSASGSRLKQIKLLQALNDEALLALERQCAWRRFQSGEQILDREGPSDEVLFVVEGRVRIVSYAASGREVAFAMADAGSHVGELAAIDGMTRSASVVAVENCVIALLPAERFRALLENHASVGFDLLRHLARIIRIGDERIAELSTVGAIQRVFREVLRLAEEDPKNPERALIPALPTQQDLAAKVGATRETVARALGQLVAAGVIERRGRTLMILDPDRLEDLADPEALGS